MSTPKATAPVDSSRENHFHFLRLVLAALVIFSHSFELIDGNRTREPLSLIFGTLTFGTLSVNGFFILSGYLIVGSWQHSVGFLDFLKKRVLRIYPAFIVALAVSVLIVGRLGADASYFHELDVRRFFTGALLLAMPTTPPVFVGSHVEAVNGAMWTIAYEFRCYLLVAILGVLGAFKTPKWWVALTTIAIIVTSWSYSGFRNQLESLTFLGSGILIGSNHEMARFVACFGAGGCYYLFRDVIHYKRQWALAALVVTLVALFYFPLVYLAIAVAGAYALFAFAFKPIPFLDRFKTKFDLSYGIYLYGWPTQKLLLWYFPTLAPLGLFVCSLAISTVCGWLSWTLVEAPFLKLKRKRVSPEEKRILPAIS